MVKFIHMADLHLDMPFTNLNKEKGLSAVRRKEQRDALKAVLDRAVSEKVDFILIAGDLFEYNYVRKSTIDYLIELFSSVAIPIFISPGNHDPITEDSYYKTIEWSDNVHVFSDLEKISLDNVNIYGKGFKTIKDNGEGLENFVVDNADELNIVLLHGTLDLPEAFSDGYNPLTSHELKKWNADYIALGHIHKMNEMRNNAVYPGSLMSLGFDEPGEHGAMLVSLDKNKIKTEFMTFDSRRCETVGLDYTEKKFEDEVITSLEKDLKIYSSKNFMKIDIEVSDKADIEEEIIEYLLKQRFEYFELKINRVRDYEEIACEKNVKGLFVRKMLEKIKNGDEVAEKALKVGLRALEGK